MDPKTVNQLTADTTGERQFLSFCLQGEDYGIEILKVQEIKGFSKLTPVPHAPPHLKGIMNLRGTIVPVIDLRVRFGMSEAEYTPFTVIIVVNVRGKVVGLVVDGVSDVLNIPRGEVQDTLNIGGSIDTSFLSGMGKVGDRIVLLLDLDKLLGESDLLDTAA